MKKLTIYFAILIICLVSAMNIFADVKIKSKQTMSGQSYENTTYIKGKRERTERNMGGMQMVNLTQCDLKRGVQLNPAAKTYLIDMFNQEVENTIQKVSANANDNVVRVKGGTVTSTVTFKDTGERRKMFGYDAKHIITTMETVSSPDACSVMNTKMQFDGWYIDAEFVLDCQNNRYAANYNTPQKSGCQDKYNMKTIGNGKKGYPVYEKMTMFDESGKEQYSMVTEVIELSQATLDASLFEIPADYREVKDSSQMYSTSAITSSNSSYSNSSSGMDVSNGNSSSGVVENIRNQSNNAGSTVNVGTKPDGVIRVGIITKTGSVGEGLNAAELAGAVQNTLGEYLKGTKIELVAVEAKLGSAIENEIIEKQIDYVLYATVSHKKGGGGGFGGMFGKVAPILGNVVPMAGMGGNVAGQVAGQVASTAIYTAASAASNIKPKDEITLEIKLQKGAVSAFSKQFKAKAKSAGEDILSPLIEQVAEAIIANAK